MIADSQYNSVVADTKDYFENVLHAGNSPVHAGNYSPTKEMLNGSDFQLKTPCMTHRYWAEYALFLLYISPELNHRDSSSIFSHSNHVGASVRRYNALDNTSDVTHTALFGLRRKPKRGKPASPKRSGRRGT
jgi:hypothetical protein